MGGLSPLLSSTASRYDVGASAARFVEQRRHAERKLEVVEAEEMGFEEAIQREADRYTEAAERKLDYQWYGGGRGTWEVVFPPPLDSSQP